MPDGLTSSVEMSRGDPSAPRRVRTSSATIPRLRGLSAASAEARDARGEDARGEGLRTLDGGPR